MKTEPETLRFQAEVQELLGLVIHSLYEHKEIFLRELVSNASDALDRLRFEALTRPELQAAGTDLKIRIAPDAAAGTLTVSDDGIGMSRAELVLNLGTIARSGTRAFLERVRAARTAGEAGPEAPSVIGQFGVGFYSCFMVAERVVVLTRRAGETDAWRWTSAGEGEYSIEPSERDRHGTSVTLHLRKPAEGEGGEGGEDAEDWLDPDVIRGIVKRYSDFVAWPIELDAGDGKPEVLNSMKPLWTRPRAEITEAEHKEFYRHLTHAWDDPFETIHFKAEGATEWTALLYVPTERPMDMLAGPQEKSRIALYVKRVLIMPDCPDLLPPWLRFVRGLVDAPDLPLNVSRETLQASPQVRRIRERLVKRVIEALGARLAPVGDPGREGYRRFWRAFGSLLKEGIWAGDDADQRIRRIALFETSRGEEPTTLAEYVSRMKPDQKAIWWLAGSDRAAVASSPHLETFTRRGEEVLFLVDPIDEWVADRMGEFEGKPLRPIDRGDLDLDTPAEKQAREDLDRENRDLLQAIEQALREHVKQARFSTRLSDSAAVLVAEAGALSSRMERMLLAMGQDVPRGKRILELNPDHALVKRLQEAHRKDARAPEVADLAELLHGQALLAEGSPLPDGARFAKLVTKLVAGTGGSR